jgi:hypothetical protein
MRGRSKLSSQRVKQGEERPAAEVPGGVQLRVKLKRTRGEVERRLVEHVRLVLDTGGPRSSGLRPALRAREFSKPTLCRRSSVRPWYSAILGVSFRRRAASDSEGFVRRTPCCRLPQARTEVSSCQQQRHIPRAPHTDHRFDKVAWMRGRGERGEMDVWRLGGSRAELARSPLARDLRRRVERQPARPARLQLPYCSILSTSLYQARAAPGPSNSRRSLEQSHAAC